VIPESVPLITAVSTRKTKTYVNRFGTFQYQSISEVLFFDYRNIYTKGHAAQIATLEKSILDYLYLHPEISDKADFKELRWNKELLHQEINWEKLNSALFVFNNKALSNRIDILKDYLES
jgi:hypothetical protein